MGAITPVGNDVATTWRALLAGQVRRSARSRSSTHRRFPVRFACEVKGFDPLDCTWIARKRSAPTCSRSTRSRRRVQAMTDAGLDDGTRYDPDRIGRHHRQRHRRPQDLRGAARRLSRARRRARSAPFFIPMFIADIAAGHRVDALQREGPELRDGLGLRHERARDRRRVSHHPVRRRRHHDHRRLRGDRHADGDRRLRQHEGALRAQRRRRRRRRVRSTRRATAS